MRFVSGRCAKCSLPMSMGQGNYNEYLLRLKSGDLFQVGVCQNCRFGEIDYPQITEAIEFHFSTYSKKKDVDVVGIHAFKDTSQVRDEIQAGTCFRCGETLGERYSVTNGIAIHDPCPNLVEQNDEVSAESDQQIPHARARREGSGRQYAKRV